jgi:hypothetical protein
VVGKTGASRRGNTSATSGRDGLDIKEIQVSSLNVMDQNLQVSPVKDAVLELKYEFPLHTFIPEDATHILAYTT